MAKEEKKETFREWKDRQAKERKVKTEKKQKGLKNEVEFERL